MMEDITGGRVSAHPQTSNSDEPPNYSVRSLHSVLSRLVALFCTSIMRMAASHLNPQALFSSTPNKSLEQQLNIGVQEMAVFMHNERGLALLPLLGESIRVGPRITAETLQR